MEGFALVFLAEKLPQHQRDFTVKFSEDGKTALAAFMWPCVHFSVHLALNRCGVYKVIDLVSQSLFAGGRLASLGPVWLQPGLHLCF